MRRGRLVLAFFARICYTFKRKNRSDGTILQLGFGSESKFFKEGKKMQKTFKGKVYDTDTMAVVKKVTNGAFGDPAGYEETLYVAENGTYFLYTNGGAQSKYPAEKLTNLSKAKAQAWEKENA